MAGNGGVTNGRLNQTANGGTSPSLYAKVGYDKQLTEDLRVRLTGSIYNTAESKEQISMTVTERVQDIIL